LSEPFKQITASTRQPRYALITNRSIHVCKKHLCCRHWVFKILKISFYGTLSTCLSRFSNAGLVGVVSVKALVELEADVSPRHTRGSRLVRVRRHVAELRVPGLAVLSRAGWHGGPGFPLGWGRVLAAQVPGWHAGSRLTSLAARLHTRVAQQRVGQVPATCAQRVGAHCNRTHKHTTSYHLLKLV
jgi:hypothetical protein